MKNYQKAIITLLTAAILLIAVFAAGRYGWKLFGLRALNPWRSVKPP